MSCLLVASLPVHLFASPPVSHIARNERHAVAEVSVFVRVASTSEATEEKNFDAWKYRRSLNTTGRYTRRVTNDEESLAQMEEDGSGYSKTGLIATIRKNNLFWQEGEVSIYLAESMGYCWGVERAVQMAYEAHKAHPNKNLHLTNEIIHNPQINNVDRPHSFLRPKNE